MVYQLTKDFVNKETDLRVIDYWAQKVGHWFFISFI